MIELHAHTCLGTGALLPAALIARAAHAGYRVLAITDHADAATLHHTIAAAVRISREYGLYAGIDVIPGVELMHVPPQLLPDAVEQARELGAQLVLVHGETITDTVPVGTNYAAINAGADIVAHPGLITAQDAELAAEKDIFLEISCRPEHGLANGHLVAVARETGAKLILGGDIHAACEFLSREQRLAVAKGAGLNTQEIAQMESNARSLAERLFRLP